MICKQCSAREVEEDRRTWATPVCFACLPPPKPLPVNHLRSCRCAACRSAKAVCDVDAYRRVIKAAGGLDKLLVLSTYTYIDDPGTTPMGPGRHIFTEWGDADGDFLCEHEEHNGEHTYRTRPELVTATAIDKALHEKGDDKCS